MKFSSTVLGVLLTVCSATLATAASAGDDERGRYEGMAASENSIWVIDTHTGKVRRCIQDFADQKPTCSGFSN